MKTKQNLINEIKEKYPDNIFHTDFDELINELLKRQYKPINDYAQGTSLFIALISCDSYVLIQTDTKGRSLDIYRKIEYVKLKDKLFDLDRLDNRNKVIYTKEETRKNLFTKAIGFLIKLERFIYAK